MKSKLTVTTITMLLVSVFFLSITGCRKYSKPSEATSEISDEDLLERMKIANLNTLQTKGIRSVSTFKPGDLGDPVVRIKQKGPDGKLRLVDIHPNSCNFSFAFDITNFVIDYGVTAGCNSPYTYQIFLDFSITNNGNTTQTSAVYTDIGVASSGGGSRNFGVSNSLVSSSGTTDYYRTSTMNFNSYYCNDNSITLSATWTVNCSGVTYWIEVFQTITLNAINVCKATNPVFVNPNLGGSKQFSVSGWLLPCSSPNSIPCHFYYPDQFEFYYRKQGTSTWTAYFNNPANYSLDVFTIYVSEAGTYEYRWRNKEVTPGSCYGPYSDIKTVVVN